MALAAADFTAHVFFHLTGTPAAAFTLAIPATKRLFAVANGTAQSATVSAGGATAEVPAGAKHALYCDGAAVHSVGGGGAGTADMAKAVYDPDGDGIVDRAEAVDGAALAGVSKYYGTDAAGAVGFHDLAAGAPRKLLDGAGDGATTAFTLAANPVGSVLAFVAGLLRTDYSVAGTTLTFTTAPASGASVVAWDIAGGAGHNGLWTEIARTQASDAAAIDLTFDPALYDAVELAVIDLVPDVDDVPVNLQVSTDGGASWADTGYAYAGYWVHSTGTSGTLKVDAASAIAIAGGSVGNAAGEALGATAVLHNPAAAVDKRFLVTDQLRSALGSAALEIKAGTWGGAAAVDGLRVTAGSGAIRSGTFVLTGRLRAARGATAEPRPHRRLVRPRLADFTALAPNSAVAETELGIGVTFTALASANDFQLLARPQPAPPYAVVACVTAALPAQDFYTYALGWRESASGRLQNNAVIHSSGIKAEVNRWDDPATFDSAPQAFPIEDWWPWLRIEDDGTEHVAYLSADGVAWLEVWRAPRTAFLTADQVYVGWNRNRTTNATPGRGALTIQHWEVL